MPRTPLIVVDDFVPIGGSGDHHLRDLAERLFRGAGNRQGRSRMAGQRLLHAARPPRALVLPTGEDDLLGTVYELVC